MKKGKTGLVLVFLLSVVLTACTPELGDENLREEETGTQESENEENTEDEAVREETDNEENESKEEAESETPEENEGNAEGETYSFEEITITFPADWEDRYVIEETEDCFLVYQKASYDFSQGTGFVFAIGRSESPLYGAPSGGTIAYSPENNYYVSYPTDVCYDYDSQEISQDYMEMSADVESILRTLWIDAENVCYHTYEYIFPMSEYEMLSEDDLLMFSEHELYLGENEILARYGYHFDYPYLQAYFERCSWYEDRGDEFDSSEITRIDQNNLAMIQAMREQRNTECLTLNAGEQYEVDLNQDGVNETVYYRVETDEWGDNFGYISINGEERSLQELGIYPDHLHGDHFYLTDISTGDNRKELAFAADGPSDDPETFFVVYDGEIRSIGRVSGFPMESLNYYDGFQDNHVMGRVRSDVLETAYGYGVWYPDYSTGELVYSENTYVELEPWYSHVLLADVPIHYSRDLDSAGEVLTEGQTVYFIATEGNHWTLVRGEDGTEGWVYSENAVVTEIGMQSEEVFEGAFFYD
ncbi:MAG: YARHG domain-containing protein [Lachnospiraceae bacterium]|nr:YARHG domain-containing protein [Lachnospiraceae bacterium]